MKTTSSGNPVKIGNKVAGYLCAEKLELGEVAWLSIVRGEMVSWASAAPNCKCGVSLSGCDLSQRGNSIVCDDCKENHEIRPPVPVSIRRGRLAA